MRTPSGKVLGCITFMLLLVSGITFGQQTGLSYRIDDVQFEVDGRSKPYFLTRIADIEKGLVFDDKVSLEAYVEERRQVLLNERVLESVEIEIRESVSGETNIVSTTLIVKTKDTWNLIALPYFKYDSNTGVLLALRGRNYNFLGTLRPLNLNLNWQIDTTGVSEPSAVMSFALPFPAAGLDWTWKGEAGLTLRKDMPVDFVVGTGIALELPFDPFILSVSAKESFYLGQISSNGKNYDDPYFFASSFGIGLSTVLYDFGSNGKLTAGPNLDLYYRYAPGGLNDESLLETPTLTPSFVVGFGRVDWKGNFRQGVKATANASLDMYFGSGERSFSLGASAAAFAAFEKVGPSARLSGFWYANSADSSAGDYIRGVLDARISTDAGIFLNLDCPIRLIDVDPAFWFNQAWMRYCRFELQMSPFFDAALVHSNGRFFAPQDGWYGAGIEAVLFPAYARSFYLRVSTGWSVPDVIALKSLSGMSSRDGRRIFEIFIGIGHFY